jgi:Na+-transporting methylmalonyl-CoA/oxaloacetate decarboxylase gamma subunit
MMLVATPLVFVVLILILICIGFCAPLAQQTGQEQTTYPSTAQHAPSYQQTQEPTILVAPFLFIFAFVLIFVLTLAVFTEKMGEEQAPHPTPTQHSAAD